MEIRILELIEGAKQAKGLTVIIDVLRAFPWNATCIITERKRSARWDPWRRPSPCGRPIRAAC